MTKPLLIKLQVLFVFLVMSPFALADVVSNLVHYINQPTIKNELIFTVPNKSESSSVVVEWDKRLNSDVVLQMRLNEEAWQTVFEETGNNVRISELISGTYSFRLYCGSHALCSEAGYLEAKSSIVLPPVYVNSRYEEDNGAVTVYWDNIENAQGYILEETDDNGVSWSEVTPTEHGQMHDSIDHEGVIHTQTHAQVTITSQTQSVINSLRSIFRPNATNNTNAPSYRFRVKTCVETACGSFTSSKALNTADLELINPDAGFESGSTSMFVSEGGGQGYITSEKVLEGSYSYIADLENWGYVEYQYGFNPHEFMNGLTLDAKLKLLSISPEATLSVYAVAYYADDDGRIEGTRYELDETSISASVYNVSSTLYLDELCPIKFVRLYARLIGEGNARIILDEVKLLKGTHIGQEHPVLSSFLSSYSGFNKLRWTPFAEQGYEYRIEFKNRIDNHWLLFYRGTSLSFTSPESDRLANPQNYSQLLDSGEYDFRLYCGDHGDCPNNYVYASLIVARSPEWIDVERDNSADVTHVSWAKTVAAGGYVLQESKDGGAWVPVEPQENEDQRHYHGQIMFTNDRTSLNGRLPGTYQYRVQACRSSGCTGEYITSDIVNVVDSSIRRVIFIHTDLLGSPVAETNSNGEIINE